MSTQTQARARNGARTETPDAEAPGVEAPVAHKTLLDALLAVQAEATKIQKNKLNPAFRSKYVSLDALMETALPVLTRHGLVWVTFPGKDEQGDPCLRYRVIHAPSTEEMGGQMPLMLAKTDPQGQGSAITYARRYSIMAVLGLVADEDDDGASASRRTTPRAAAPQVTASEPQATERQATAKQRGLINARAGEKNLEPLALLNLIRAAIGKPPVELPPDEAQAAGHRILERLPARYVDPILEAIATAELDANDTDDIQF